MSIMSSAPPPPPRKRRPEEGLVGSPPRTRTRAVQRDQNDKAAKVFAAMSAWHMGAERKEQQWTIQHPSGKTVTVASSAPAADHGPSLFNTLTQMANTSKGARRAFEYYRPALRDASQTAHATSTVTGSEAVYENSATSGGYSDRAGGDRPGNPRSRRMMAALQARDEAGRFTDERQ